MNILTTITMYPPAVGGAQSHTHQIMRVLNQRHRVQVATFWHTQRRDWLLGTTLVAPANTETYHYDDVPVTTITVPIADRLALVPSVATYYLAKRPAIKRIADRLLPQLQSLCPDADLIHCGRIGREPLAYAAFALARERGIPFIFTPYHHPRWVGWNYEPYLDLYRAADGVLVMTPAEVDILAGLGVQRDRIFVVGAAPIIAPGANSAAWRKDQALEDCPIVLFLGQKYPYKGWELLLQAAPLVWMEHPETRFVFAGPRTAASRRAFAHIREPRIIEIDAVDEQTKANMLAACNIFCLPSSQESYGMVYAEAWSMGKPAIGLDIPAVQQLIENDVNGYRVPAGEFQELARRLSYLLSNPQHADQLGRNGQRMVAATTSWERVASATESAYDTVLSRFHSSSRQPDSALDYSSYAVPR